MKVDFYVKKGLLLTNYTMDFPSSIEDESILKENCLYNIYVWTMDKHFPKYTGPKTLKEMKRFFNANNLMIICELDS